MMRYSPRHRFAAQFRESFKAPRDPSWSQIAFWAAVAFGIVPIFLDWCGSF